MHNFFFSLKKYYLDITSILNSITTEKIKTKNGQSQVKFPISSLFFDY